MKEIQSPAPMPTECSVDEFYDCACEMLEHLRGHIEQLEDKLSHTSGWRGVARPPQCESPNDCQKLIWVYELITRSACAVSCLNSKISNPEKK
jgi:hypothetical protein